MPTLDWIGKRAVLNHHREIPFHLLEEDPALSAGDPAAGNLLVQGTTCWRSRRCSPTTPGR